MLIEVTVKQTTETKEFREINFPYYSKDSSYLYCILDETNIIAVGKYLVANYDDYHFKSAIAAEPATEIEFIAAYTSARAKTTMPNLQPSEL